MTINYCKFVHNLKSDILIKQNLNFNIENTLFQDLHLHNNILVEASPYKAYLNNCFFIDINIAYPDSFFKHCKLTNCICSSDINSTKFFTISPDLKPFDVDFHEVNVFPARSFNINNISNRINIKEINISEYTISDSKFIDINHDEVGGAIKILTSQIDLNIIHTIFNNLTTFSLYNNVDGEAIYLITLSGKVQLDRLCIMHCSALDSNHFISADIRSNNETSFVFNNSCIINCPNHLDYTGQTMEIHASSIFDHLNISNNHPERYAAFCNSTNNEKNLTFSTSVSNTLIYNNSIIGNCLMLCPNIFSIHQVNFIDNVNNHVNKTVYFTGYQQFDSSNLYFNGNVNFSAAESSEINQISFEDYCFRKTPEPPAVKNNKWVPYVIAGASVFVITVVVIAIFMFRLHFRYRKLEDRRTLERSLQEDFG